MSRIAYLSNPGRQLLQAVKTLRMPVGLLLGDGEVHPQTIPLMQFSWHRHPFSTFSAEYSPHFATFRTTSAMTLDIATTGIYGNSNVTRQYLGYCRVQDVSFHLIVGTCTTFTLDFQF